MPPESGSRTAGGARLRRLDLLLALAAAAFLAFRIAASSRANIVADSVDYYAILQWVTPAREEPIVRNLHFAEQRSPGYSLTALIPYALLTAIVEPLVPTERMAPAGPLSRTARHPRPGDARGRPARLPPALSRSESRLIPPQPLLLKDAVFKDFYVPRERSWFQWKLFSALALTSYLFLFLGIAASARTLRRRFPLFPGYSLVLLAILSSPVFMHNILRTPLYATLTAFGASALFVLFFVGEAETHRRRNPLLAGLFLGLLVLTRLETGVLAAALGILLLVRREHRMLFWLVLGSSWALIAWVAYNWVVFETPVHLGILRGDINLVSFRAGYVLDSLIHPSSGIVFWTPLLLPGLAGLLAGRSPSLRMLGVASLALIGLCLLRVPVMYERIGGAPIDIGGILVTPPESLEAMRRLMRSDNNRYLIVLLPALVLGVREGAARTRQWMARRAPR